MADPEHQLIFEKLNQLTIQLTRVETILTDQVTRQQGADVRIDDLRTDGCVVGKDHEKRLGVLELKPEKTLTSAGILVSIGAAVLSGIAAFVAWMKL